MTKFLLLTGPPASGKLTISKHLATMTGFKLFHNQLTVDLAISLFEFSTEPYVSLCERVRKICIECAIASDLPGLIFTFCYEGEADSGFINDVERCVIESGGEMVYVHLTCSRDELMRRVQNPDRLKHKKLNDTQTLEDILNSWKCESSIPGKDTIVFNSSVLAPEEIAELIVNALTV